MAVSGSNLTSGSSAVAGTSFSTASITPTANNLVKIAVYLRNGSSINPTVSSISGNGLTWVKVASVVLDTSGSSRRAIEVWRAMGASPSAGAVTITTTESETGAAWAVDQFSGVDTSGTNGSGAIVQSVTNKDETGATNTLTVTLAAFADANNATYGAFADDTGSDTTTAGSGFSKLGDVGDANANVNTRFTTEFKSSNDTSVDLTWSTNPQSAMGGIAVEIKAAAVVGQPTIKRIATVPFLGGSLRQRHF
jgi:hypothetical protein